MKRFGALVLLVCAVTAVVAPAAWARDKRDVKGAEAAFIRYTAVINKRQWGRYFDGLHPAQKRLLNRNTFMACIDGQVPEGVSVTDVKFSGHQDVPATVPGTQQKTTATALTVQYVVHDGTQQQTQNGTVHVVWAKSRWTWVLSAEQFQKCSGAPVLVSPTAPGS